MKLTGKQRHDAKGPERNMARRRHAVVGPVEWWDGFPRLFAAPDRGADFHGHGNQFHKHEESSLHATTLSMDLAKLSFLT